MPRSHPRERKAGGVLLVSQANVTVVAERHPRPAVDDLSPYHDHHHDLLIGPLR
jgi:hypothetical protein